MHLNISICSMSQGGGSRSDHMKTCTACSDCLIIMAYLMYSFFQNSLRGNDTLEVKRLRKTASRIFLMTMSVSGVIAAGLAAGSPVSASTDNGPLTITMWVNPPAVSVVQKINKEFEKKYGVKVNLETAANDQAGYTTLEQTSVQAGTADIMAIEPFNPMPQKMTSDNMSALQEWAVNNVFMPLNGESWVSGFNQDDLAAASYKGKDYGLVTGVYQTGLFYNKAIFKKYNLKVPTTYAQFLSVCKALKLHNVTPVWTGIADGATFYLEFLMYPIMQDALAQNLGSASASQALAAGKIKWTDPKMVTAFQEEKNIASNDFEHNYAGESWQQMPGAFAAGKAAMLLDGSWDIPSVLQANPKIQIGYFPIPGSNTAADNNSVSNPDLTWVVLNNSKHKDLAEKWLAFFASKNIYEQYVQATGISPSENGAFNSTTATAMGQWFGKGRVINQTPDWVIPNGPYYLQSNNFWTEQLKMLQGSISPATLAQQYQQSQNQASS